MGQAQNMLFQNQRKKKMIKQEILDKFKGKRCLVTGGTGMIGQQVCYILRDAGAKVVSAALDAISLDGIISHNATDLRNFRDVRTLFHADFDYVFHVAGIKGNIDVTKSKPASFFTNLIQMNTNVLEACRLNNIKKAVYTSSIGAYGKSMGTKEIICENDHIFHRIMLR